MDEQVSEKIRGTKLRFSRVPPMPTRRLPTQQRERNPTQATEHNSHGKQLNRLLDAIEEQRDHLSRAESLLGCLQIAMEHGEDTPQDPYYPDVAQIAREMLKKTINALDPIRLPKPARSSIKEEFCALAGMHIAAEQRDVPMLLRASFTRFPWKRSLRIHRRNYSRPSAATDASRMLSALANSSGSVAR
jgi:hypothetical protein